MTCLSLLCVSMLLTAVPALPDSASAPAGQVPLLQSPTMAVIVFNPCPALPRLEVAEQNLTNLIANGKVPPGLGNFLLEILEKAITVLQNRCN